MKPAWWTPAPSVPGSKRPRRARSATSSSRTLTSTTSKASRCWPITSPGGSKPGEVIGQQREAFDVVEVSVRERSEEHTSELQSRPHLVCRLLLEKKKQ